MNPFARIASILVALMWALLARFLVADLAYGPPPLRAAALFGFAALAILALFSAWRWPRAGGWIAVAAGVALLVASIVTTPPGAAAFGAVWFALPFVLTGLLFVATGEARAGRLRLSRRTATLVSVFIALCTLALIALTLLGGVSGGATG